MAEETDGCKDKKEDAGNQIDSTTKSDVSVTEKRPLGTNEKPTSEMSNLENAELVSYHAQHVPQVSKSLVPTRESNADEQMCTGNNGKLISKHNSIDSPSSTALSGNNVTRTMNDGDKEKSTTAASSVGEENIDNADDRRGMNNQLRKGTVPENNDHIAVYESAGVSITADKSQKNLIQGKRQTSHKHQNASRETVESQRQHASDSIEIEFNVQSKEKDILNVIKGTSYKSAKDSTVSAKCAGEKWQNECGKNSVEKDRYVENCFENTRSLEAVTNPKRELIDHSDDTLPDYVGGKSPTFDKFDQPGAKAKVLCGIKSEDHNSNKRYLDADILVVESMKEEPKKLSSAVLLDSITGANSVKLDDTEVIMKVEGKESGFGNLAINDNDDNDMESQDKLQEKSKQEIVNKDDNKKKGKCKQHRPVDDGSVDLDVKSTLTRKNIFNGVQVNNSKSQEETPIIAENSVQKVDVNERSNAFVNGENGSSKSSIEDSDNSSDSEVEFTKRASNDPNFATVYSFLSLFGHLLNLPECSLDELEQCLDNCNDLNLQQESHGFLEQLHLKLLRRLSRSCKSQFSSLSQVSNDRLIKYLIKFSKYVDLDMAWDLEKFGYHVLGSEERLILLKALCEIHFDENPRFKVHFTDEYIKSDNFEAMRLQPEGHDMLGNAIWYQQDKFAGFRVYSVEEDDDIGKSWKLLASTLDELDHMLESLKKKAEINPKDVALSKRKERKEKRLSLEQKITHPRKGRGKAKKTRRKKKDVSESESDDEDENPCAHCFSNKRPDMVLLCDKCDAAYHTLCLRPPLLTIPEGDWNCPYCQQLELIDSLQSRYKAIAAKKKALERVSKRAVFDDVKLSNIVENDADSGRSGRHRSKIDYNFTNYNQLINDAISNESTHSSTVTTSNFYHARSGRQRTHRRRLNNLDSDSADSESSEYEDSDSGNEREKKRSDRTKNLEATGCRRSRRLKRKYGDEKESESSESEEENFVRRSSRRQKPSRKTYVDYESDDTPEEVILKKKARRVDDSDEYVASGSEDPEDVLLPRRSRRIINDEDDEEDTPDFDDDETDVDEVLCEDMEKNVVSDETEDEELIFSPSDEDDDHAGRGYVDSSTDDEDDVEDVGNGKKRKCMKEKQTSKRGGKDIRNIIKSMREEVKKSVKTEEENCKISATDDSGVDKEDKLPDIEKEAVVSVSEKGMEESPIKENGDNFDEESKDKKQMELNAVETGIKKEETETIANANSIREDNDCEENSTEFSVVDLKISAQDSERYIEDKQTGQFDGEKESSLSGMDVSNALPSTKHDAPAQQTKDQTGSVRVREYKESVGHIGSSSIGIPSRDQHLEESYEKRASFVPKASPMSKPLSTFQQNAGSSPVQYSPEATIALGSFNPILKYARPQRPFHPQEASSAMQIQHQSEVLRPRPYPADSIRRPYESYQQGTNANYPTAHNPYHVPRPMYENLLGHQALFPQRMHGFPRIAPPQYPGFSGSEQQAIWRQRYPTPMQWGYPGYHNMSNQGDISQQVTQMHRPYLDIQNANDGIPAGKSQSHPSSHAQETSRRLKTKSSSNSDSRMPSATESYAAFRNMVIGSTEEGSQKRLKRP